MKTKVLKGLLPALVMVLAIGLSFATVSSEMNQQGYYWDPDDEEVKEVPGGVDCLTTGEILCTYDDQQVFADEELEDELYIRE